MNQKTTNNPNTAKGAAALPETMTGNSAAADELHQIFNSLPVYSWQTIKDIPFKDGPALSGWAPIRLRAGLSSASGVIL